MARSCTVCGKGAMNSAIRSHSNISTKHKQHVNLQTMVVNGKRVKACSNCLRTQTKTLAVASA